MGILSSELLSAATCCVKKSEYSGVVWSGGACTGSDGMHRYRTSRIYSTEPYSYISARRDRTQRLSLIDAGSEGSATRLEARHKHVVLDNDSQADFEGMVNEHHKRAWQEMYAHGMTSPSISSSSKQIYLSDASEEDTDATSVSLTSMAETVEGFEWGWFDDVDDYEDESDVNGVQLLEDCSGSDRRAHSSCPRSRNRNRSLNSCIVKRQVSSTFQMCRTFPPLHFPYDVAYIHSKVPWLQSLPSNRHLPAQLQIRMFRIVQTNSVLSENQHAEFLIEVSVDGHYKSQWLRYSSIARFVMNLSRASFRKSHQAWKALNDSSRWFSRLELNYLHQRCKLLEKFAYTFLLECANAHTLAELLEAR